MPVYQCHQQNNRSVFIIGTYMEEMYYVHVYFNKIQFEYYILCRILNEYYTEYCIVLYCNMIKYTRVSVYCSFILCK